MWKEIPINLSEKNMYVYIFGDTLHKNPTRLLFANKHFQKEASQSGESHVIVSCGVLFCACVWGAGEMVFVCLFV